MHNVIKKGGKIIKAAYNGKIISNKCATKNMSKKLDIKLKQKRMSNILSDVAYSFIIKAIAK